MRDINDVVQHPDGDCCGAGNRLEINLGMRTERMFDELGEVDRSEVAGTMGRQGYLATRIGGADGFGIPKVVTALDAIDEDHARITKGNAGCTKLAPELTSSDGLAGDTGLGRD